MRALKVQNECVGRKKVRGRKCQGKWYEFYDEEVQKLKRHARKLQLAIKHAYRNAGEVRSLVEEYRERA